MDRHTRQSRLVEVGPAGQARLAAASVTVPGSGLAASVAARYLAGAGVGRLRVDDEAAKRAALAVDPAVTVDGAAPAPAPTPALAPTPTPTPAPTPDALGLEDPSARAVGEGAFAALRALSAILAGDA